MKFIKITRAPSTTSSSLAPRRPSSVPHVLSLLLCTVVISACGSSKDSKSGPAVIGAPPPTANPAPPTVTPANPQQVPNPGIPGQILPATPPGAPLVKPDEVTNLPGPAPVGPKPSTPTAGPGAGNGKTAKKSVVPDFKETTTTKTGSELGDLNYTSSANDGLMEAFRITAGSVSLEQQQLNRVMAQSISSARLVKSGNDMILDLAVNEGSPAVVKTIRMKASVDGNKMNLTLLNSTATAEFKAGFLKCLEVSCDDAYAKIKFDEAYIRIIFRNNAMNNRFQMSQGKTDVDYSRWENYITNTVQGIGDKAQIASVKSSSFEIVNGISVAAIQLLTLDKEVFSFATPVVAPDQGTEVTQEASKYADPSAKFNLPGTAGKSFVMSKLVKAVKLVNNNGQGGLRFEMSIGEGLIWMTLYPAPKATMTPAEVKAFEATFPQAW